MLRWPPLTPLASFLQEPFQLPEAAALADAEVRHPPPHRRDRFPHPRHRHDEAGPGLRRQRPQPGPHVQPAHPGREAINPGWAPSLGRGLPSQRAGRGRTKNSLGMLLACSRCGESSPLRKSKTTQATLKAWTTGRGSPPLDLGQRETASSWAASTRRPSRSPASSRGGRSTLNTTENNSAEFQGWFSSRSPFASLPRLSIHGGEIIISGRGGGLWFYLLRTPVWHGGSILLRGEGPRLDAFSGYLRVRFGVLFCF